MVLQSPPGSQLALTESAGMYYDRRKSLVNALHELKNRISSIEQQHPSLRDDLSSICDRAILSLQDSPTLQNAPSVIETVSAPPPVTRTNPLSLAVDKTGAFIISGLDRMGDGIIFIFAKIGKAFS